LVIASSLETVSSKICSNAELNSLVAESRGCLLSVHLDSSFETPKLFELLYGQ